jgi:plastocyanin
MMTGRRYLLFVGLPLLLAALIVIGWPAQAAPDSVEHQIALDASQYAFVPGRLTVNQGDRVVITLNATDVVHGLYLEGYGIKARVTPGESQRLEFIADQAGKFRYRCSVSCGELHPFMIGELVVKPNDPFAKSAALAVIGVFGMLGYIWFSGRNSNVQ